MHSFYIDPPAGGVASLPPEEAKHAAKVLRLRPGDEVCGMDGAAHAAAQASAMASGSRFISSSPFSGR